MEFLPFLEGTNVPRTLMTASICAAALFPAKNDQEWNENAQIFSVPFVDEYLLAMSKPCPQFNRIKNEYYSNCPELEAVYLKYQPLMKTLSKYCGRPIRTFNDVNVLYNTLDVENEQNKT